MSFQIPSTGLASPAGSVVLYSALTITSTVTASNVRSQVEPWADVKAYGATANSTTNQATFIQAAISASKNVYFPAGTYRVEGILNLIDGSVLRGAGKDETILQQFGTTPTSGGLFYAEGTASTAQLANIVIQDMTIDARVATTGFSENQHIVAFSGVRDTIVERVKFLGFRGDGLYVAGQTHNDNGLLERHNYNITVRDCIFDGVNKDNRNGISIIDCDGALIKDCYFTRVGLASMPGPIDIEPDSNAYHVVRGIKIYNNNFYDIRGSNGAVSLVLGAGAFTVIPTDFEVIGNTINVAACAGFFASNAQTTSETAPKHNIVVSNNYMGSVARAFHFANISNILIENNRIEDDLNGSLIGESAALVLDVKFIKNSFLRAGSSGGTGLSLNQVTRCLLEGNFFIDCGNLAGSRNAVGFGTDTSDFVTIKDNVVISPGSITTIAFQKEAAHTFTTGNNRFLNNLYTGFTNNFTFLGGYYGSIDVIDGVEIADPAAPGANNGRIYFRQGAAGTELCVVFASGAVQVLASMP